MNKLSKILTDDIRRIQLNPGLWNFIDKEGNILFPYQRFKWVSNFHDGFACVQREDRLWNFMDINGNMLSTKWFNNVDFFFNGFARVQFSNKAWNMLKIDGTFLFEECSGYKWVSQFQYEYTTILRDDDYWNLIDKQGHILSPNLWFNSIGVCYSNYATVQRDDFKWNFIDLNGNILSPNQWYKSITPFHGNIAGIQRNDGQWSVIDRKGNILRPNFLFNNIKAYNNILYGNIGKDRYYIDNRLNIHKLLLPNIPNIKII